MRSMNACDAPARASAAVNTSMRQRSNAITFKFQPAAISSTCAAT